MRNRYASADKGNRLRSADAEMGIDNSSEENILPMEGVRTEKQGKHIVMETSYDVTFVDKDRVVNRDRSGIQSTIWTKPSKDEPITPWPGAGIAK